VADGGDRRLARIQVCQCLIALDLFDHTGNQGVLFRASACLARLLRPPGQNALQSSYHGLVLVSLLDLEQDHLIQLGNHRLHDHSSIEAKCQTRRGHRGVNAEARLPRQHVQLFFVFERFVDDHTQVVRANV
jgi:hypothetical protein